MRQVKSSNIAAVGHDGKALHIKFTNGTTYRYDGVPAAEHHALLKAKSVGSHFVAHIRDKYVGKKVS